jgi:hypothetical protein
MLSCKETTIASEKFIAPTDGSRVSRCAAAQTNLARMACAFAEATPFPRAIGGWRWGVFGLMATLPPLVTTAITAVKPD